MGRHLSSPGNEPAVFEPNTVPRYATVKTIFTFAGLYKAYVDCRHNKGATLNHLRFGEHLEGNLLRLEQQLQARTYKPGQSIAFVVTKPKVREIFAAGFDDRVVHHLLYNYLAPIFEKIFIYDSWACRKGKGTHHAVQRLQGFLWQQRRLARGKPVYYLKMDVMSFFTSIDQQILYDLVCKKVTRHEVRWLSKVIIFHDCARDIPPKIQSRPELFAQLPRHKSLFYTAPGVGLPIGNLTSQFFANVYLNELDQFVKHRLKVKHYLRYVDDLVLLGDSEEGLRAQMAAIEVFAREHLHLRMHPNKQFIRPSGNGVDFLGYIVRADYVLMRRRVVGTWRHKLDQQRLLRSRERRRGVDCASSPSLARARLLYTSYGAHAMWGNCRSLVRVIHRQYFVPLG